MCISWKKIENPYTHKTFFKECGKCTSCIEKSNRKRERLIRNHHDGLESLNYITLFITLNYSNEFCPYIKLSDIENIRKKDITSSPSLPIYRKNNVVGHYYNRHKNRYSVKICRKETVIDKLPSLVSHKYFHRYDNKKSKNPLTPLVNDKSFDHVGVCVNSDASAFIKRLRAYLSYRQLPSIFSYYKVSEYGPTTSRPHFHLEITFRTSSRSYKTFSSLRTAVCSCWQYSSFHQRYRNVEIARNPAAYISRYMSRGTSLSDILLFKEFKAKSSHSLYYGYAKDFSPEHFYKNFSADGSTTYIRSYFDAKQKQHISTKLEYPSYVLYRYLPRPKGLRLIPFSELLDVYTFSSRGQLLLHSAGCSFSEINSFRRRVLRAFNLFSSRGLIPTIYDYVHFLDKFYYRLFLNRILKQHTIIESGNEYDIFHQFPQHYVKSINPGFVNFTNIDKAPSYLSIDGTISINSLYGIYKETVYLDSKYNSFLKKAKDNYTIYQSTDYRSENDTSKQIINKKNYIYV